MDQKKSNKSTNLDLVFVTTVDHLYTLGLSLESLLRFHDFKMVHIVTDRKSFRFFRHLERKCGSTPLQLIDEDTVLPGMSLAQLALCDKPCFPKRAGWYFQQFLKLGVSQLESVSANYVVVDADTIFTRKIPFFGGDGRYLFTVSSEYHEPYFDNYTILMGEKANREFSFISQYMVFNKSLVGSMLRRMEAHFMHEKPWHWLIIDKIKGDSASLFSEYETYGHYLKIHHPECCGYLEEPWLRLESHTLLSYFPSRSSLSRIPDKYAYVSYEQRSSTISGKLAKRISRYIAPHVIFLMNLGAWKS